MMHYFEIYYICVDRETGLPDSVSVNAPAYTRVVCKFNALGLHLCVDDDITLAEFEYDGREFHTTSIKHSWEYPDRRLPCVIYDSEEVA